MKLYTPRLRIILDPIYNGSTKSSIYKKYVHLAKELTKRKHYVYWCIPSNEYVPKEFKNNSQVLVTNIDTIKGKGVLEGLTTDIFFSLFNRVSGDYHIDCIVTSRTKLALYYRRLLEAPRFHDNDSNYTDKSYGIPTVIIEDHIPCINSMQHLLSYVGCDMTIFSYRDTRQAVITQLNSSFRSSLVTKWLSSATTILEDNDLASVCRGYSDLIETAARNHINRYKTSRGVINLLEELEGDVYTWGDIVSYLRNTGRLGVSIGNINMRVTFTYDRSSIHHAIIYAGFVDLCDGPVDKYMKRSKFDELI